MGKPYSNDLRERVVAANIVVVTPCQHDGANSGSHIACPS
jgi:hypothetical protein